MARKRRRPEEPLESTGSSRYEIILAPDAVNDLDEFRGFDRSQIREGLEKYLRYQPTRVSKSRIKRLQGLRKPQYRLRIGDDIRIFYDVHESRVDVLAILSKSQVEEWLKEKGILE